MADDRQPATAGRGSQRTGAACKNCHIRKIKCDLAVRGVPPCSRCRNADLPCDKYFRRRRVSRAIEASLHPEIRERRQATDSASSPTKEALDEVTKAFSSLGVGDQPRPLVVAGMGDISKQSSILADFLAQDFSLGAINDYQVTFNDNYSTIARVLANEFGHGFTEGVYHHRDAPFVKRSNGGGIPRSLKDSEKAVLELQGSFILPSQRISDSFVTAFFDRLHPFLPIVDRSEFMKHYYSMGTKTSNISLLLLQSVLLSGSTAYTHPDLAFSPGEVSWKLYIRAKALVESRFEQDRLTLVQAHLLFSTFVADSCDDTIQNMWLHIGAAVRIAQGLGMHRALGKANASLSMRRQWKRIWWTLFVHDTMCSFEWGRPRSINLADSDVEPLHESDFQPEEAGSLPSTEHTQLFLHLNRLCLIIASWLDHLRPGGYGQSKEALAEQRPIRTRERMKDLSEWYDSLPTNLRPPEDGVGFSLWAGALHITYNAAVLRFAAILPEGGDLVYEAATRMTASCEDLHRQNLLCSLWNFGIHEFDLAMGQYARQAKSREYSALALNSIRRYLPLMRSLINRSSVAKQSVVFYEQLVDKIERGSDGEPTAESSTTNVRSEQESEEGSEGLASFAADSTGEWPYGLDFHDMPFPDLGPQQTGHPWGWEMDL